VKWLALIRRGKTLEVLRSLPRVKQKLSAQSSNIFASIIEAITQFKNGNDARSTETGLRVPTSTATSNDKLSEIHRNRHSPKIQTVDKKNCD
jgi:hypothetical protein